MPVLFSRLSMFFLLFSPWWLLAQPSLETVEKELQDLAHQVLYDDSLGTKIKRNKEFSSLLIETLRRPESYRYPFDSLKTISILQAEDNSFRIFTWHIVDKNYNQYYSKQYHYFFGLVQRRYEHDGQTDYLVIPLLDMQEAPAGVENMVLDNYNWFGAQYYPPKNSSGKLESYTLKFLDRANTPPGENIKEIKQDFYVLLGWNGNDQRSNIKLVEVMSFDPEDPEHIIFGADVFYFDMIPKYRAVFQYSEFAPFTLNYAKVKKGWFGLGKKEMIVYDHLAPPKYGTSPLEEVYNMGPDGSYDALYFYKRRGYFEWYRDVELADKFNNQYNRKQVEEMRERERKKLEEAGIILDPENNER
jgi:hypothetical protein